MDISIVGCGRIFRKHIEAIQNNKFFNLISLCDDNKKKVIELENEFDLPVFDKLDKLFNYTKPEIIVISTPSGLHPNHSISAAEVGVDVICEKPMSTRWLDAKQMIEVFDKNKRNLFIVKQNRLNPTVKLLKKSLENNDLGKIFMVNANVFWCRPQNYYDQDYWRGTWELDGGALMNQASHYVDLLDWLFGSIKRIHCFSSTLDRKIEVEDTAVVNLQWRSGTLGSLNVTMLSHDKNYEGSITVIGEKGTIKLSGQALNKIDTWIINGQDLQSELSKSNYDISNIYGNGHKYFYEEIENFYKGKANNIPSGREGLRSLELLISFYLSSREDRPVALPLDL